LNKSTEVTLKGSVIGSLDLYNWLNHISNGNEAATRNVSIDLQSEDHCEVTQTWKLIHTRIVKLVSEPMKAKGTNVAMEELTLAYERLEME